MNARLDRGQETLLKAEVLATKIGGLNACLFQSNLKHVQERVEQGKKQILVVSALRSKEFNTTDELLKMVQALKKRDFLTTSSLLHEIAEFHYTQIKENVEPDAQDALFAVITEKFFDLNILIGDFNADPSLLTRLQNIGVDWIFTNRAEQHQSLTGFGEDVAQEMYKVYLDQHKLSVVSVEKEGITQAVYEDNPANALTRKQESLARVRRGLSAQARVVLAPEDALVVEGGAFPFLATERSYSDATAAEMARAASETGAITTLDEQKQTTIMTADGLSGVKPIRLMSPALLREFTGTRAAGSKVLQARAAHALKGTKVDIVVHNPDAPQKGSTLIPHDAGLEVDELEIVMGRKTKTVLRIEGNMAERKGVLAAITRVLGTKNIDQTVSTRATVTLTLDDELGAPEVEDIERLVQAELDDSFTVKKHSELGLLFCLGGSQREHPSSTASTKILMANRVMEPPFAAQVMEGGEEGVAIPFVLTVEGPMSDSPGVLEVITEALKEYNIDQTFSTESTWTITLDETVSEQDLGNLHKNLNAKFGNGWTFETRTQLRVLAQTEAFDEHPLINLLNLHDIPVHYMHAIPERGVSVIMIPQNCLSSAAQILHNFFHDEAA